MPAEVLETETVSGYITVKWRRTDSHRSPLYEFHFRVDGRMAIFTTLTKVKNGRVTNKKPNFIQDEVIETIQEYYPDLQPITNPSEFEVPECLSCGAETVHSDKNEEWFCPFCQ